MLDGSNQGGALREFGQKISRYFLEFLETDFHRQQAPRRRIQLKNDANQTTGTPLRKYEALYRAIVGLLAKDLAGNGQRAIAVSRGRYRAPINPVLRNLVDQYVDAIDSGKFKTIGESVLGAAKSKRGQAAADPEKYISEVTAAFEEEAGKQLVHP